jgi:hypothetical protein
MPSIGNMRSFLFTKHFTVMRFAYFLIAIISGLSEVTTTLPIIQRAVLGLAERTEPSFLLKIRDLSAAMYPDFLPLKLR